MSQKTKLETIKELNDYRVEISNIKSLEEIQALSNELTIQSSEFSTPIKEIGIDNLNKIIAFIENVENIPFNLTAPTIACYDKLKELTEEDSLGYAQIKVIQTILVGASWSADKSNVEDPLKEGRDLLGCLKALESSNIRLSQIEQRIRLVGARESEIDKEIQMGLQFKDAAKDDTTKMVEQSEKENKKTAKKSKSK